jgi:hypothetical protein
MRPRYQYQVVSGAALYGSPKVSLRKARESAAQVVRVAALDPGRHVGTLEIERILVLPSGGRRYWRMAGRRWTTDWHRDLEERKPAWSLSATGEQTNTAAE